jgi:hypothetical protein
MIESVEEERLFEPYCTHEAGAYKILLGSPEKKDSCMGVGTNMCSDVEKVD